MLEGFAPNEGGPSIPFIQFVDDSLFMLEADLEGLRNLKCIVMLFEALPI